MGITKLGLKLFGTHAIVTIVELAVMLPLLGIFEDSQIYQWFIGLVYIGIFWLMVYADMTSNGLEDCKKDQYAHYKGFVAGLIASIPAIVLYIIALVNGPAPGSEDINWYSTILRAWLVPYTKIFLAFKHLMPQIAIIPIMILPLVSGFSYMNGPRKRKKILDAIERSDALRAEKSKADFDLGL